MIEIAHYNTMLVRSRILIFTSIIILFSTSFGFSQDEISFDVEVIGLEEVAYDVIKSTFEAASLLENYDGPPLVSVANLRSNLNSDIETLEQILRAEGYYNSEIQDQFTRNNNHFEFKINVIPGNLYTYGDIKITFLENPPSAGTQAKINESLGIESSEPARAEPVISAEGNILNSLPKYGHPFAMPIKRDFVVDHKTQTLNITFELNTGSRQRMGIVQFNGLENVSENYLRKFITWPEDSYFEQRYIDELRSRLIKSNLFSGVNIDIQPGENDHANIIINHIETKHRTIGTSVGYSTAEGFGGEVSWHHRNFLGDGKRLKVTLSASEIEQSLAGLLEIPHFKRLDQTLSFGGLVGRQDTDAFLAKVIETRVGIDRVVTEDLALLANVELEYNDVTDIIGDRDFLIVAFPVGVRWDSSDNLLDPNRGVRASFITAPGYGLGQSSFKFLKTEMRASGYFPLTASEKLIFALRTRLGSIIGVENETLPATRRFFSGGGGSIRGYGFQRVGPLGMDDNPLGGRSVNEAAAELRWKFENNLGLVLFTEGGNVYEDTTPQFKDFRYAAGIGARYSTGFGPVRFDVAFPLNKRTGDSSFQIYISLGQAF